jgi:hypothetical protein
MSTVSSPPPVRHGQARLIARINGCNYSVRRIWEYSRPVWLLKKLTGRRAGSWYTTGAIPNLSGGAPVTCTCEDQQWKRPLGGCKHIRALDALGLLSADMPQPQGVNHV